jgi:CheY-like chemotaxis protein
MGLVYTLTASGQDALASEVGEGDFPLEVNFPQDYRRLLAMIEVGGHEEVIRGRLRRFPDRLIDEWLKELEELKMVTSREAGELDAITFSGARLLPLDVMLPDGNGFDILAQLRGRPEFSTLPIVLLTAKAELVDIRNGLALGADGYITKPYSKNQLAEVIGRVRKH